VSWRATGRLAHHRFDDLPSLLQAGDLIVVNTSVTMPAAVPALTPAGEEFELHLSTELPGGLWAIELRRPDGRGVASIACPECGGATEVLALPGGAQVTVLARFPTPDSRLWVVQLHLPGGIPLPEYLARHGHPIRYGYVSQPWPAEAYRTVYGVEPGSAEMPSAGRAFTPRLLTDLVSRGVGVAPITLHTGVSSLEAHEPPYPERYRVPADTARKVNATHDAGGRVVAVGTTVVRALETVVEDDGAVHAGAGWTDLMVTPERGVRAVDGLLTGWHEPEATHLLMLEAVGGLDLIEASYREALAARYLWHEFGDLHLLLP
jgi:S-adenosylmethionine:tRNA ribosyltransferase-isomerase